jgi:hypothetical protein
VDLSGSWVVTSNGKSNGSIQIRRLAANRYHLSGLSATVSGDYELRDGRLMQDARPGIATPCTWRLTDDGALEALAASGKALHTGDTLTRAPRKP